MKDFFEDAVAKKNIESQHKGALISALISIAQELREIKQILKGAEKENIEKDYRQLEFDFYKEEE